MSTDITDIIAKSPIKVTRSMNEMLQTYAVLYKKRIWRGPSRKYLLYITIFYDQIDNPNTQEELCQLFNLDIDHLRYLLREVHS
jgi:hypothetical protein